MGEEFGKKVRDRIHWITQNVYGNEILDVGCSQGIVPILLGREGKKVLGLDISASAIADAEKYLSKEEPETQNCVSFEKDNFFLKTFTKKYDTLILGEVLEHITDVEAFFKKAVSTTKDNGRIIVTTPFGINEFIDHKRTFYLLDFIKFQENGVIIDEIKFFGKWIGIIYIKTNEREKVELTEDLLSDFEEALYKVELEYLGKIKRLNKKINSLKKEKDTLKNNITELNEYKNKYILEMSEKVNIEKELLEQYNREEMMINENRNLRKKYEQLLDRYNNMRNSTLGKLTVKYWRWRNKRSNK